MHRVYIFKIHSSKYDNRLRLRVPQKVKRKVWDHVAAVVRSSKILAWIENRSWHLFSYYFKRKGVL